MSAGWHTAITAGPRPLVRAARWLLAAVPAVRRWRLRSWKRRNIPVRKDGQPLSRHEFGALGGLVEAYRDKAGTERVAAMGIAAEELCKENGK